MILCKRKAAVGLLYLGLICLMAASLPAQEEGVDDAVIQMIVDLLADEDRDMRALGLQQVREEAPGEAATKKFAELLPTLSTEGQAGLLEALGDRGDEAAKATIVESLNSEEEAIRAAALRALGALGDASDVHILAQKAADESAVESTAARQSLVKLRGEDINRAIVTTMADAEPNVRVQLLDVLSGRNAKEALPTVFECAKDADIEVRLAALVALRYLADESHTATLVETLKTAEDDQQRRKAELALLVVCSRGGAACADGIIAGLADAEGPARIALLRALARAGGENALAQLVAQLKHEDEAVADEAMRMLSIWPDKAVVEHLLAAAKSENPRHQVLAVRGLVQLADAALLGQAMELAPRVTEKRLVLGALGTLDTPEALALAVPAIDEAPLAQDAALAAVMIAERIEGGEAEALRTAMEKVVKIAKEQEIRDRAQKVLDAQ